MSSDYSPNPDSIQSVACARAASSSGPSHTNSISEPHLMQAPMMFNKLLALIFFIFEYDSYVRFEFSYGFR